jgi:PKHD-type hydroxylase
MKQQIPNTTWGLEVDTVSRWAYAEGLFTNEECDQIIKLGYEYELTKSVTIGASSEYRDSRSVFIEPNPDTSWIYRRLTDAVMDINSRFFNFDLFGFTEGLQFTEYTAPGGKYNPHIDKLYLKSIRKLSITVQLTDPNEYEGGDFEILDEVPGEKLTRTRGTLLAFPSYTLHAVTPVTKGTRNSLVSWVSGKPFK